MPVDRAVADRDTLIFEYMPMAAKVAKRLAPKYLRDDLIAESYLILCRALDKRPRIHTASLEAYLSMAVRKGVLYAIRKQQYMESLPQVPAPDNYDMEIHDILAVCCTTAVERQIMTMRMERYTIKEVAQLVGWKRDRVRGAILRVRKRCMYRMYGQESKRYR